MRVCREVCSKGPGFHAHLGSATMAVGSFLLAVVLGKSGRFIGVIPVLLLITVVAWLCQYGTRTARPAADELVPRTGDDGTRFDLLRRLPALAEAPPGRRRCGPDRAQAVRVGCRPPMWLTSSRWWGCSPGEAGNVGRGWVRFEEWVCGPTSCSPTGRDLSGRDGLALGGHESQLHVQPDFDARSC
jgi:hypothetical protein